MLSFLGDIYTSFKEAIIAGLVAGLGVLAKQVKKEQKNYKSMSEGVGALLQDRLFQTCNHYIFNQGFLEVKDLNNITNLYDKYHNMGGNGVGTELVERCKQLPLVSDQEARERLQEKSEKDLTKILNKIQVQEDKLSK